MSGDGPAFVRPLSALGEPCEPLTLDKQTQEHLDAELRRMRDARDAAAVSGAGYVIHGHTTTSTTDPKEQHP